MSNFVIHHVSLPLLLHVGRCALTSHRDSEQSVVAGLPFAVVVNVQGDDEPGIVDVVVQLYDKNGVVFGDTTIQLELITRQLLCQIHPPGEICLYRPTDVDKGSHI